MSFAFGITFSYKKTYLVNTIIQKTTNIEVDCHGNAGCNEWKAVILSSNCLWNMCVNIRAMRCYRWCLLPAMGKVEACLWIGNTILNINEKNEIDKIKMFMSKEFVGYFAKIISDIIEVRHDKLFVKT